VTNPCDLQESDITEMNSIAFFADFAPWRLRGEGLFPALEEIALNAKPRFFGGNNPLTG